MCLYEKDIKRMFGDAFEVSEAPQGAATHKEQGWCVPWGVPWGVLWVSHGISHGISYGIYNIGCGALRKSPTPEASGKPLGGTCEASGSHLEASRAI